MSQPPADIVVIGDGARPFDDPKLEPDRDQLKTFVDAVFRHSGDKGYVSVRSFYDDEDKLFRRRSVALSHGLKHLVDVVEDEARRAAHHHRPVVFCPPLAVLSNGDQAREEDLLLGLLLSVDCDMHPQEARTKLEQLLGAATVVSASGGEWVNPQTGEIEPKLHLHWRLKKPTNTLEEHAMLKEARQLVAKLVRSDRTSGPIVHPLRWPGSWHRKVQPRLAQIIATSDNEIDLREPLGLLRDLVGTLELPTRGSNNRLVAHDPSMVAEKLAGIPNDEDKPLPHDYWYWNRVGMATWAATSGSEAGRVGFHEWSAKNKLKYNAARTDEKWRGYKRSPPSRIGYGTLHYLAQQHYQSSLPPMPEWMVEWVKVDRGKGVSSSPRDLPGGFAFNDVAVDREEPALVEPQQPTSPNPDVPMFELFWHGRNYDGELRAWLVKDLIFENGTGLASGQWGTAKTFTMIDLAASVMTATLFAGREIVRQGGVLFVAAEGANEIPIRLKGLVEKKLQPMAQASERAGYPMAANLAELPFAWINDCPNLQDDGSFDKLVLTAKHAAQNIRDRYDLPLVLIIIDTFSAAGNFKDANDAAEGQRVMNRLAQLSRLTGAFVLVVDHFGKAVETGTRGTTVKEASADVVLALLADREINGTISNTRMALRKLRGGKVGIEAPFDLKIVDVGDGETTCVVEWRPQQVTEAIVVKDRWPTSLRVFKAAMENALAAHGELIRDGSRTIRAVPNNKVRPEFMTSYPADDADAKRKAYRYALKQALGERIGPFPGGRRH